MKTPFDSVILVFFKCFLNDGEVKRLQELLGLKHWATTRISPCVCSVSVCVSVCLCVRMCVCVWGGRAGWLQHEAFDYFKENWF